jgi:hypothetical protein
MQEAIMKYTVLVYGDERKEQLLSEHEQQALLEKHAEFASQHDDAVIAAEALEPTTTARTLRLNGDSVAVSDGPFAEAPLQLGGFYLIDAPDLDSAVTMVKQLPVGHHDAIEVRPVIEM